MSGHGTSHDAMAHGDSISDRPQDAKHGLKAFRRGDQPCNRCSIVFLFDLFSTDGIDEMKRIALLVCVALFLVTGTAEARRNNRNYGGTYSQPARMAPTTSQMWTVPQAPVASTHYALRPTTSVQVAPASYSAQLARPVQASAASFSTSTAQGVANIMASQGRVGHWGGNPGYEGCGMGATPQAAFNSCCYSNSGMATVDVGYAQGGNGMWYCCRRYR